MIKMKYKNSIFAVLLGIGLLFTAFYSQTNSDEKEAILMQAIFGFLDRLHFQPAEINDDLSKEAFNEYLNRLDGGKRFFTQEIINNLKSYENHIDDEINMTSFEFFDKSEIAIREGIRKGKAYFNKWIDADFDFNKKESFEVNMDKRDFVENDQELEEFWRKSIKLEILERVVDYLEEQEDENFKDEVLSEAQLVEKSRKKVKELYERWFDNLEQNRRKDWMDIYFNSITALYDPHTVYLSPTEKQNFDMKISGTFEGIGATLRTDKDYTRVVRIIPGGPAWKAGELEEDDLIYKVAQSDEEPVDVKGEHIDDVVSKIRGKKGTKVRLTVKKKDGSVQEISIIRDVVVFEATYAKSLILGDEEIESKVGYIHLPSFYAKFGEYEGRSCANDVADELRKLQSENVGGVILDLRNNGGGALNEVVDMAGLFIEEGPIVQVKYRDRNPTVMRDKDPNVVYDGPLVVLVNSYSASASEILAGALQDYQRAVIVGSNSTFGKGTVQRMVDIDRAVRGKFDIKPLGNIKMTTQKFYRIDGGSVQLKGVEPDVVLPYSYDFMKIGERENEHAMEWTSINPVEFYQDSYIINNVEDINQRSKERIMKNETFNLIKENAKRLEKIRSASLVSLNIDEYRKEKSQRQEEAKKFKNIYSNLETLSIENLAADIASIEADSSKIARNIEFKKSVQKDIYLNESMHIIQDMIDTKY